MAHFPPLFFGPNQGPRQWPIFSLSFLFLQLTYSHTLLPTHASPAIVDSAPAGLSSSMHQLSVASSVHTISSQVSRYLCCLHCPKPSMLPAMFLHPCTQPFVSIKATNEDEAKVGHFGENKVKKKGEKVANLKRKESHSRGREKKKRERKRRVIWFISFLWFLPLSFFFFHQVVMLHLSWLFVNTSLYPPSFCQWIYFYQMFSWVLACHLVSWVYLTWL